MIKEFILKDGRKVIIKKLTIEDYKKDNNYEFVHSWINQVNKYLNAEFNKEDLERDKKEWYKYLSTTDEIAIGAIYDGKIIGTASLRLNLKSKKTRHVGDWGIAIHPDFHNNGLGMELLTIIEKIAEEKGLIKLEADFYDGNKSAETLYLKKLNYKIEGRRKYAILLKDGTYVDKICIGKIFKRNIKK